MTHPTALHAFFTIGLVTGLAGAQAGDAERLIDQLVATDAAVRSAARSGLVDLGAAAVAPLAQRLAQADDDSSLAILDVLRELAPVAGGAIEAVRQRMHKLKRTRRNEAMSPVALPLLATLAELIPHGGQDDEVESRELTRFMVDFDLEGLAFSSTMHRLHQRQRFPRTVDLAELRRIAAGRSALPAEVAVERLGRLGPAARAAVAELRAVLDRPEPRMLWAGEVVPLHRKAARALLAIAPDAPEAAAARAVLAGTWTTPERPQPNVPERVRVRIDELGAVLRDSQGATARAAAVDNLVALGALAAPTFAALLEAGGAEAPITDALTGLQRLGRHGAAAVPSLVVALRSLPAQHTIAVLQALGATAPWSSDVFDTPSYSCSVGSLAIAGHRIAGTIDVEFLNAFSQAFGELQTTLDVPADATPTVLRELLTSPMVGRRRRALEIIAARGTECSGLLDALAPMLTARPPNEHCSEWIDASSSRMRQIDRSDQIQRLAAAAILAVAPSDHALVIAARDRLAQPEAK